MSRGPTTSPKPPLTICCFQILLPSSILPVMHKRLNLPFSANSHVFVSTLDFGNIVLGAGKALYEEVFRLPRREGIVEPSSVMDDFLICSDHGVSFFQIVSSAVFNAVVRSSSRSRSTAPCYRQCRSSSVGRASLS